MLGLILAGMGWTAEAQEPEPWKTAARLRVSRASTLELGSGTVIASSPERSIVLTCAHLFKSAGTLTVDLFGPDLMPREANAPGRLKYLETHPGRLLALDRGLDVALVVLLPGRVLDASPVAPEGVDVATGQALTAIGCSEGADATAWTTRVVGRVGNATAGEFVVCDVRPKQGRSGGGLYNASNQVVGVCDFASDDGTGLYAAPASIRSILTRASMTTEETGRRTVAPSCPPGTACPPAQAPQTPGFAIGPRLVRPQTPPAPAAPFEPAPATPTPTSDLLSRAEAALPDGTPLAAIVAGIGALFIRGREPTAEPTTAHANAA